MLHSVGYVGSQRAFNPIKLEGKRYLNLTTASQKLQTEGSAMYLIPKSSQENLGTNIAKSAVKNYVYDGSEDAMKRHTYKRYYIQNALIKTESLVKVLQNSYDSSWNKIRYGVSLFGY